MANPFRRFLHMLNQIVHRARGVKRQCPNLLSPPRLEDLEDRTLFAIWTWIGTGNGNWSVAENWSGPAKSAPPNDRTAQIQFVNLKDAVTSTINQDYAGGKPVKILSLTIKNSPNFTLNLATSNLEKKRLPCGFFGGPNGRSLPGPPTQRPFSGSQETPN